MNEEEIIDYEIGQDNVQIAGLDIHNPVFGISALLIVAFVVFVLIFQDSAATMFGDLRKWLTSTFDWVFMISGNIIVLFCLFLALSPLGKIRIGGNDAKPEFSYSGWFAMLFAAGMGIGLMFYGVLEPVYHFQNPPLGLGSLDQEAARSLGMAATIFHWGLHPWAIYAIVGLALSYFCFSRGLPLTIRSAFYPLFGNAVWGWFGHVIDTLAVFATLFGLATSLGLGANQASAGLEYLFGLQATDTVKIVLILGITSIALISVMAGLEAGVKRLSEINMLIALTLFLFVIAFGHTMDILTGFFTGLGNYLKYLVPLSNWVDRPDTDFLHGWTTFYWAWWISWSPFVGMFIARISKGRSIREFVFAVLIVPTLVSVLWMNAFGGTAVSEFIETGYTGVVETVTNWHPELSLYKMLEPLPLTTVTSALGIVLVIVFFVTSSDSGSIVVDTITAGGKMEAPVAQRVFWCLLEGLVAIALLLGGGLNSLQAAAIATGFPFAIVLILMCFSLYKGLSAERRLKNLNPANLATARGRR